MFDFFFLEHFPFLKTTIKILSGELGLQEGDITYDFKNGKVSLGHGEDIDMVRRKLGVCPQHNNLLGDDTCRETLRLFASLKGNLPMDHPEQTIQDAIDAEVERRLDDIDFTSKEDADKPVKTYSGGMKRKVSIAISLLGDPEVVFLGTVFLWLCVSLVVCCCNVTAVTF